MKTERTSPAHCCIYFIQIYENWNSTTNIFTTHYYHLPKEKEKLIKCWVLIIKTLNKTIANNINNPRQIKSQATFEIKRQPKWTLEIKIKPHKSTLVEETKNRMRRSCMLKKICIHRKKISNWNVVFNQQYLFFACSSPSKDSVCQLILKNFIKILTNSIREPWI